MSLERTVRKFVEEVNRLRGDSLLEIWYSPWSGWEIGFGDAAYVLGRGASEDDLLLPDTQETILRYFGLEELAVDLGLDPSG
jgi:hypothetical protein